MRASLRVRSLSLFCEMRLSIVCYKIRYLDTIKLSPYTDNCCYPYMVGFDCIFKILSALQVLSLLLCKVVIQQVC